MATAFPLDNADSNNHLISELEAGRIELETNITDNAYVTAFDNASDDGGDDGDLVCNEMEPDDTSCQSQLDSDPEALLKTEPNIDTLKTEQEETEQQEDVGSGYRKLESYSSQKFQVQAGDSTELLVPKIEAYSIANAECKTNESTDRMEQLQGDINQLSALLFTKEQEWNKILRLKKLKEVTLLELRRKENVIKFEEVYNPEGELVTSVTKPSSSIITTKYHVSELESRARTTIPEGLSTQLDGPSTPLPEMSPKLAAALNGSVANVQSPQVRTGTKRKTEHNEELSKKSKVTGTLIDAPSFNYADVLSALAKISAHEQKQNETLVPSRTSIQTTGGISVVNRSQEKAPIINSTPNTSKSSTVQYPKITSLSERFDSTLTLASLLADSGFCQPQHSVGSPKLNSCKSQVLPGPVLAEFTKPLPKSSKGKNRKTKKVSRVRSRESVSVSSPANTTNSSPLVSNAHVESYQNGALVALVTNTPTTALCQFCSVKQALFICAGCENQWYCSRECQSTAWVTHSQHCAKPK